MNSTRGAPTPQTDWADEVLRFWFTELSRQHWFAGGAQLDEQVLFRFLDVYRMVAAVPEDVFLADARAALAAVIVLDQFSRNMFRSTPHAFANDAKARPLPRRLWPRALRERSAVRSNYSSICHLSIRKMSMPKPEAWSSFLPWAIPS